MRTIHEVLSAAEARGVKLRVDGNDLAFRAPRGALTPELRQALVDYKAELLAFFRAGAAAPVAQIPRTDWTEAQPAPLSAGQRRLWFLERLAPGSAMYHVHFRVDLDGPLDRAALAAAVAGVVARHPTTRMTFDEIDGEPVARIAPAGDHALPISDVSGEPDPRAALAAIEEATAAAPFDLVRGPLFRARLVVLGPASHALLVTQHHLVTDAASLSIIGGEIVRAYQGQAIDPPALRYADYVAWADAQTRTDAAAASLAWWQQQLADLPRLELPTRASTDDPFAGDQIDFALAPAVTAQLKDLARREGTTLYVVLYAAWAALLARYSGQTDLGIGTVVAGREQSELAGVLGFFVNTLVLRADLSGDPTGAALVARCKRVVTDALEHGATPFDRIVAACGGARAGDSSPLFRAAFGLENVPLPPFGAPGMTWTPVVQRADGSIRGTAKFELGLQLVEKGGGLVATLEYSTARFDRATAARLAAHYARLAAALAASPDEPVAALSIAAAEELSVCEGPSLPYPALRLDQLVRGAADAIAVEHASGALTYAQLDARANQLAHWLQARGVGPEVAVGVCQPRTPDLVVSLLAVLKAGGYYVPLDPAYPDARRAYMLEDSRAAVVLDAVPDVAHLPTTPPPCAAGPGDLAYCIYTSGSTGQPKGVALEHRNAVSFVAWAHAAYDRVDFARVLAATSICFDLSIFELFATLAAGGTVVLVDNALALLERDLPDLSLVNTVPSAAQALVAAGALPTARVVNLAGEPLRRELADAIYAAAPATRLYNLYGPTEYTTYATWCEVPRTGDVTIGRPLANTTVELLDAARRPVPLGATGELWLRGAGLARGYLHRPDLTAARFVDGAYRTGDLARIRADGEIEYLGRIDHQVKIRGFRIELGEIEAALGRIAGVREAVVVARDGALVAYLVGARIADPILHAVLAETLPEHMVPAAFAWLPALPLTPNGKIDRKALPAPDRGDARAVVAPRTPAEEILAGIWHDVLGTRAGITDDFFALGGHSLVATQVIARIRAAFGVALPMRALFDAPTIAGLARRLHALAGDLDGPAPLVARPRPARLPLSAAQERLWFLDRLQPNTNLYNIPVTVTLAGPLDVAALARALDALVARHEILRTTFPAADGAPTQRVAAAATLPLEVRDVARAELPAALAAVTDAPFDLSRGPLARAQLLRVGADEHVLALVLHHIVCDGWSLGVILRELRALYSGDALPPLPVQYADYALWQRTDDAAGLAYWRERLRGAPPALELPTDRPRPPVATVRGGAVPVALPPALADGLAALARRENATLFMALLAAWQLLLHRYAGEDDLVVGTPVAGRSDPATEALVGVFVNTLAIRVDLGGAPTLRDVLHRVREATLGAFAHPDVPFERVVDAVAPARDLSRTPIFQVMFVLQNTPLPALAIGDARMTVLPTPVTTAKFDLLLSLAERDGGITGALEFNRDLFDESTAARMASHFETLVASLVAADAQAPAAQLAILPAAERDAILARAAAVPAPLGAASIHARFEAQVAAHPHAIAAVCGDARITYAELDARANQLAHALVARGVTPGDRVALVMGRDLDMIAALLGVLKAGAAYVPIEPSQPAERRAHLLADAGAPVVIERLDAFDLARFPTTSPRIPHDPARCAYVIYTSGSTGKPKGVQVSHANVLRLFTATDAWFGFDATDVWTMFHSYAFDFSVWEIWGALLYGGRLVVVPYEITRTPDAFHALLARERVTVLNQTPSAFRLLVAADAASGAALALRTVVFGGEAIDLQSLRPWFERHGDARPQLVNMYGITETTVHVTYRPLSIADLDGSPSPIGVAIPDLYVHVLDPAGALAPIGVPGELYVGGAGVALGYLARPELDAARFVADPFRPGERLYRTGDRGRHLAGGGLEYMGRLDFQVKIRGFRIELGEIETALGAHPGVREVCVLAREQRLVAYVVGDATAAELRAFVAPKLPEYMIPAAFVALAAFPLTSSGKIDRRALPAPDAALALAGDAAPETPAELALARIWCEVLGLPRVGIDDRFFELGGDSILSIQVVSRAQQAGLALTVRALFQHQTIRALAAAAGVAAEQTAVAPFSLVAAADRARLPAALDDAYPLALLQTGMVFHGERHPGSTLYHDQTTFHIELPLEPAQVRAALDALAAAHPILRTSFDLAHFSEPLQLVHARVEIPLVSGDWRGLDADARLAALLADDKRRPFAVDAAPLARVYVHRRTETSAQLTLVNHHAILDGWSVAALLTELLAHLRGDVQAAPPPASHYRELIALERAALASEELRTAWDARLAEAPVLALPEGRATVPGAPRRLVDLALDAATCRGLHALARSAQVPLKSVLLAAHVRTMAALGGQHDVVTGLVANGRPEVADAERALGLFLNTLPFRQQLGGGTWRALVQETFAREQELLPLRRYPLAELQRRNGGPLFETVFNFIHFHVYKSLGAATLGRVRDVQSYEETNFPLLASFSLDVTADGEAPIGLQISVSRPALSDAQFDEIAALYVRILEDMARDPDAAIADARVLSDADRAQLAAWAGPALPYPAICLHETMRGAPDAIAVEHASGALTYAQLDARANQLAHWLQARGVGPDVAVGVCQPRTPDLVVSLLAVLKAGGYYVPLDPAYPDARRAYMLEDSRAAVVLDAVPDVAHLPTTPPPCAATPGDLAYCIYTSGSTGQPKGVALEHRNAVSFVAWAQSAYARHDFARVLAATSICFDLSIFELFATLAAGGTVVLVDNALALLERDLPDLSLVNTVPSAAQALLTANRLPPAGVINLAGEPLRPALADGILAAVPGARLYNLYGPTEYTTYSTWCRVHAGEPITIGRPLANTTVEILDSARRPVPLGVTGEIWIRGAGLARGYLHRPELTAARFVDGAYRTGDLGRFRPDGEIEYLGRIDHQVKIRGFRIELGEIETALGRVPGAAEVVVVAHEGALVAYLSGAPVADATLRATLAETLPEYMVPSVFVWLPELPHTPNGKVDRKQLPAPERRAAAAFIAPRMPLEEVIAGVWADVLGVPAGRVGATDDFFALGGHSLVATQVVSRLRALFCIELPLRALFEAPTVTALARRVDAALGTAQDGPPPLAPQPRPADVPLSFAQQRLWFLDCLAPDTSLYTIPLALRLTGALDVDALARALTRLAERHEVLRTTLPSVGGQPRQHVAAVAHLPLARHDAADLDAQIRALVERPFDLARGPLVRADLLRVAADDHVLLLSIHHAIADGWSLGVLVADLGALYLDAPLPPLPVQYADYAIWQRRYLAGSVLDAELAYWTQQLRGAPPLALPVDHARGTLATYRGANATATLAPPLARELTALARREGATLFMVLLAAWEAALARWTGQADFVVGTPIAGRTDPATERLVGLFLNTLALRADVAGAPSGRELVRRVRETTLGAYAHQRAPFEQVVERVGGERDLARSPVFQVMLVLQNAPLPPPPFGALGVEPHVIETNTSKFELTLAARETTDGLACVLEYNADLFDAATAERLLTDLEQLLTAIVADPDAPLVGAMAERPRAAPPGATPTVAAPPATDAPLFDATEHALARVWADVLGAPAAHARESFFAAGGHSLAAVALIQGLAEQHGETVSLAEFFRAPTLEGLAAQLRAHGRGRWSPVVPIETRGDGPPLWCVHPGLGTVARYDGLSRALGARPFYALASIGLEDGQTPDATVEQMAARYLGALREVQPSGPYLLAGHSFGGLVAFELAQQLVRAGERVERLVLLDTVAPAGWGLGALDAADAHALAVAAFCYEHGAPIEPSALRAAPIDAQLDLALAALAAAGRTPGGRALAQVRRMIEWRTRVVPAAYAAYRPQPYASALELVLASEPLPGASASGDAFGPWSQLARTNVYRVPGDHHSMLRAPHLPALATVLARCLTRSVQP